METCRGALVVERLLEWMFGRVDEQRERKMREIGKRPSGVRFSSAFIDMLLLFFAEEYWV